MHTVLGSTQREAHPLHACSQTLFQREIIREREIEMDRLGVIIGVLTTNGALEGRYSGTNRF
jgi:hypothetical protein